MRKSPMDTGQNDKLKPGEFLNLIGNNKGMIWHLQHYCFVIRRQYLFK